MNGIFNIDKPGGMTSHDVVARVRHLARDEMAGTPRSKIPDPGALRGTKIRVGHAGTLDPMATGVLPVVLGAATRLVEYLADADKAYRAIIMLGATSDTYDREGTITPMPGAVMPSRHQAESALEQFRGEVEQVPPMHSAIKVGGKKLYELARQGVEVERQPRHVTISRLDLEAYRPPLLSIFVECSKGTYIRSLAYDLGNVLGTGAYLEALQRTRHGPFTIQDATTLEGLQEAFKNGTWQESLYPPAYILRGWPVHAVTEGEARDILQGKPVRLALSQQAQDQMMAATTQDGELLAILYSRDGEMWWPKKVFPRGLAGEE